ncbi:MAG: MBL fold metallo-hydrolase [Candidatus Dormibacteraeota bacterium]|nr:MBL fold metallo-hydrolase [Candidatus Dormibacteraeota bacterium]
MKELTEVSSGVFELRLPIPWEDGRVNCFLLPRGERVDLIDCGMNGQDSLALIRAAARQVAGPEAKIGRLVVTHIHPDHYGGAGELTERDGAQLFLHRLEVPMVHPRYLEIEQLVQEVGHHLQVHGVPPAEVAELKNASRGIRQYVGVAAPALQLDGSETLQLGTRRLRVEWTPGHSPGHICLFDRESGLLFAGDQLLPDTSPNIGLHPQSTPDPLDDYLAGLRRLTALKPRLILPAHGRPFDSVLQRVSELEAHHARRKEQILALIGVEELSAWSVATRVWGRRADLIDSRMALQEGLAHLQSLSQEGQLEKLAEPGRITWRRPSSGP